MFDKIKADVKSFMSDREKDEDYYNFIKWQKKQNELVVLTMYSYEDIKLPKTFDIVFQVDRPTNFIQCKFMITQAIFNGLTLLNQINKGHKHICIIKFDKEIPDIFNLLPFFDSKETLSNTVQLGFCDKDNFEYIKSK